MAKKRIAVIDRELCRNTKCGYQCMKACPVNRSGEECIVVEEGGIFPLVNESICIGCLLCDKKCEKMGFNAISVVNLPEELNEGPVHRYGINEFALFRLPIPKRNFVVGLIGPNGIGKSTVLNILSGTLRPNLGSFGKKEVGWSDIIQRFRGSELQAYLEMMSRKGVKVGYKPQHVDLIPKMWKGKVKEVLVKADHDGRLRSVVDSLGISGMLEKNVTELSGGELQLLAIAGTLLKKCDFYFFDEPSSYLDVKQRLMVSKEIRKLIDHSYVMVVEHDLAVLDYLSDHVHLIYGKAGMFGVVSGTYGVRVGINSYLEGYIKEENVRFRDKSIYFSKTAKSVKMAKAYLSFSGFSKRFEGFSLKTEPGDIYKGEIIGILGPNGIGKTTFIKMLVGELKPDKGEAIAGFRLAYKPQRLVLSSAEQDMTVSEFLEKNIGIRLHDTEFKKIMVSFGVMKNADKSMKNLSGGELQAVFILSCLGKEHDVMLLDEPSAFLDVEQRLNTARLVRAHAEATGIPVFVIDHDLQMIDSVSNRLMVFDGKPGVSGSAASPESLEDGMNRFLKNLDVTFRRDPVTGRARANKPGSQKEREQKDNNAYYYMN
jgi:ATP-binding cassette subfamily E protein 1